MINKVLSVGERKFKSNNGNSGGGGGRRDRWVQFETVASAHLSLQDLTIQDAALDRESTSRLLQEYLSLPVEEYSLLDPKWVVREEIDEEQPQIDTNTSNNYTKNSFRVIIPLQDMLGVDICPQVSIEARPDPLNSQVTLVGTKAVLGSPGLDERFNLKLVAVMRCRRKDRHLPGRPVQRLKQWAAKRRGNGKKTSTIAENLGSSLIDAAGPYSENSIGSSRSGSDTVIEVVDVDAFSDQVVQSSEEEEEIEEEEIEEEDEEEEGGYTSDSSSPSFRFSTDLSSVETTSDSDNLISSSFSDTDQPNTTTTTRNGTSAARQKNNSGGVAAQAPLLDCKVQINMAVKVPGALRVVPNGLLGYAGSVITKTVLNAVLPNFLQLLSTDFKQWVAGGGRRPDNGISDSLSSGEDKTLFPSLISSSSTSSSSGSSSGSERPEI